ncbi:MAG: FxsA family protein [Thermodesulfobacteriota bacterium]
MFIKLLLIFTLVPLLELIILIKLGNIIGILPTIALVIITGILGASLTRKQGISTLNKIQLELNRGKLPAENLINGVLILAGGILLLTPGLLTDCFGFLILIPQSRNLFKKVLKKKLKDRIDNNKTQTTITIH